MGEILASLKFNPPKRGNRIVIKNFWANGDPGYFKVLDSARAYSTAYLMLNEPQTQMKWNATSITIVEGENGYKCWSYKDSDIKTYLNSTFYDLLSNDIKSRLITIPDDQMLYNVLWEGESAGIYKSIQSYDAVNDTYGYYEHYEPRDYYNPETNSLISIPQLDDFFVALTPEGSENVRTYITGKELREFLSSDGTVQGGISNFCLRDQMPYSVFAANSQTMSYVDDITTEETDNYFNAFFSDDDKDLAVWPVIRLDMSGLD